MFWTVAGFCTKLNRTKRVSWATLHIVATPKNKTKIEQQHSLRSLKTRKLLFHVFFGFRGPHRGLPRWQRWKGQRILQDPHVRRQVAEPQHAVICVRGIQVTCTM